MNPTAQPCTCVSIIAIKMHLEQCIPQPSPWSSWHPGAQSYAGLGAGLKKHNRQNIVMSKTITCNADQASIDFDRVPAVQLAKLEHPEQQECGRQSESVARRWSHCCLPCFNSASCSFKKLSSSLLTISGSSHCMKWPSMSRYSYLRAAKGSSRSRSALLPSKCQP